MPISLFSRIDRTSGRFQAPCRFRRDQRAGADDLPGADSLRKLSIVSSRDPVKDLSESMEAWAKQADATGKPLSSIPKIRLQGFSFFT